MTFETVAQLIRIEKIIYINVLMLAEGEELGSNPLRLGAADSGGNALIML